MRKTSIEEIVKATGGSLVLKTDENYITGVKHDSRDAGPEDMFAAIIGDNQDGHDYILQAYERGCKTVMASHTGRWLDEMQTRRNDINLIIVENTVDAIGRLAAWYIAGLDARRIAVTGSVGKTSTRDMIYYVLSKKYNCGRNLKNFNNNIGLPISIFRFDENTEAAVLEMGMDAFGEIEYLSGIVKPEIGVITNIGIAHMEKLGSREGIFKAKMEITRNIVPKEQGGTLVYAGDSTFLTKERTKGDYKQIEIGCRGEDDRACEFVISEVDDFGIEGIKFSLTHNNKKTEVRLPVPGAHNALNGAIALAVGNELGVSIEDGARGLAKAELTGSRLRKIKGKINGQPVTVIDDTYNANPASMMSALDVLAMSKADRKVAVLGDMFELGDETEMLHHRVGEYARELGIDQIIAIGDLAKNISDGALGTHFPDKEAFLNVIDDYIRPNDMVLIKASRGMHMEEIVGRLK